MKKMAGALICSLVLLSCGNSTPNKPAATTQKTASNEGKQLFYTRCASCHMVNKELTGPALRGVENRWPDKAKLFAFIRNSQEVIATDKYAHDLWLQYNQTQMLPHPDLTDAQIRSVLDYINSVSE